MSVRQQPKKQRLAPGRSGVLDAALKLFARDGIDGVSLQQIANSLGVTKAAVYYHFQAKADIVLEALKPGLAILDKAVQQAEKLPAGPRQAELIIAGLAECIATNSRSYQVIMADSAASRILETDPQLVSMFSRIREMLAGGRTDAQAGLAVSCFLGACLGPSLNPGFESFTAQQLHDAVISAGEAILLSRLP